MNARTAAGDSALILAGWNTSNLALVRLLLKHGAQIDSANNNGDTPLMDAAYLNKLDILAELLARGANPQLLNKRGRSALALARQRGHHQAVALLTDVKVAGAGAQ